MPLVPAAALVVVLILAIIREGAVKPAAPAPPVPMPGRVRVVVDTSASMAGYFGGKTEFKDFLATLVADLPRHLAGASQKPPEINYVFVADSGQGFEQYPGSAQNLIDEVLNNKVMVGGSSMLQDVLAEIKNTIQNM